MRQGIKRICEGVGQVYFIGIFSLRGAVSLLMRVQRLLIFARFWMKGDGGRNHVSGVRLLKLVMAIRDAMDLVTPTQYMAAQKYGQV